MYNHVKTYNKVLFSDNCKAPTKRFHGCLFNVLFALFGARIGAIACLPFLLLCSLSSLYQKEAMGFLPLTCMKGNSINAITAPEFPQYARLMTSCVLPCFSGGTEPGLHARGQIKSKANCTHFTM